MISVLLVHNHYQEAGGEDVVVAAERALLECGGHKVATYSRHNDEIVLDGCVSRISLAMKTIWANNAFRDLRALIEREKPDIAHFHNTFPLISPAAYYACRELGVPVVQTLHNYRLLCPAVFFLRDGKICEDCVDRSLWQGIYHGCYHGSRLETVAVAMMLTVHKGLGTWTSLVDCYIALTEFARKKFEDAGLPANKIVVKPNFVSTDPWNGDQQLEIGDHKLAHGSYVLFAGRLSEEKGVRTLLRAFERLHDHIPLEFIGDGPLRNELETTAFREGYSGISFRGRLSHDRVQTLMKRARFLVFPSEWYETFGLGIVEAFASGLPVICSRLAAMQEIVEDHHTGLHFDPGDSEDLAAKVEWAWTHPRNMDEMGRAARAEYKAKYTAERNYGMLLDIYQRTINARNKVRGPD